MILQNGPVLLCRWYTFLSWCSYGNSYLSREPSSHLIFRWIVLKFKCVLVKYSEMVEIYKYSVEEKCDVLSHFEILSKITV